MGPTTTIEIWCDAPPYPVVEGCSLIGIRTPEDVRWCRVSHFHGSFGRRALFRHALNWLRRLAGVETPEPCSCGAKMPELQPFRLLVHPDDLPTYLVGQCQRCGTVFWEEKQDQKDE
jgi:hypothetical protein